jgi:hypothetical protein
VTESKASLLAEGYIEVAENGDPLWKLHRGGWWRHRIVDAKVGPDGQSVFIKVAAEEACDGGG